MSVRSRFAPSPTGYLHIGGARTALFALLTARQHDGRFVLRIDDTDRQRSTREFHDDIVDSLQWLGLDWHEGPYYQRQRFALYRETAERLLSRGQAFRCFCTPEELDAKRKAALAAGRNPGYDGTCRDSHPTPGDARPSVLRFRSPRQGETVVHDVLKGRVAFRNEELDDLILVRSDGSPTYNFCSVVDDADLRISHVIRGDDHLTNTPRQVLLFQAIDAPLPQFAHLPLILGRDRAPLSKRHGATAVRAYREAGYLPDALVNFLARLGWAHGDDEMFARQDLERLFRLEDVGNSAGVFNAEKLAWLNAQYLQQRDPTALVREAEPFLPPADGAPADAGWLAGALATLQPRAKTLVELGAQARFYLRDDGTLDPKAAAKFLNDATLPRLARLRARLDILADWNEAALHETFTSFIDAEGVKLGKVAQPVRVALTGSTASPGIFQVMAVLGKQRCLDRIDRVLVAPSGAAET